MVTDPGFPWSGLDSFDYQGLLAKGVEARNAGNVVDGLTLLARASAKDRTEWQAFFELGVLFQNMLELRLAAAMYESAVARRPSSSIAARRLIEVLGALKDLRAADFLSDPRLDWTDLSDIGVLSDHIAFRRQFDASAAVALDSSVRSRFAVSAYDHSLLVRDAVSALGAGVGFAHVRLGDGEGALMADDVRLWASYGRLFGWAQSSFARHFLGLQSHRQHEFVIECRDVFTDVVEHADVLAFPVSRRVAVAADAADVRGFASLVGLLLRLRESPVVPPAASWPEMHWDLLRDGSLARLVGAATRVLIVTGKPGAAHYLRGQFTDVRVDCLRIPDYASSTNILDDHWDRSHSEVFFGHSYESIRAELKASDLSNVLVLVGAGPLGKRLLVDIKRAGGVGIDIGAVMDVWAGFERPNVPSTFRLRPDSPL